jgi:hypothetical protein
MRGKSLAGIQNDEEFRERHNPDQNLNGFLRNFENLSITMAASSRIDEAFLAATIGYIFSSAWSINSSSHTG